MSIVLDKADLISLLMKLSQLSIDIDKDWLGKNIYGLGNLEPSVARTKNIGSWIGDKIWDQVRSQHHVMSAPDTNNLPEAMSLAFYKRITDDVSAPVWRIAQYGLAHSTYAGWLQLHYSPDGITFKWIRFDPTGIIYVQDFDFDTVPFRLRTSNPTLEEGRLWYRSDLDRLYYAISGSVARSIPYGTIDVDSHASRHIDGGDDEITSKLDFRGMNILSAKALATSTFSTSSTSFVDVTGLSVSITLPVTSNVLVVATGEAVRNSLAGTNVFWRLVRGTTVIKVHKVGGGGDADETHVAHIEGFDMNVPSGTYTYKLQMCVAGGTGFWEMYNIDGEKGEIFVIAFPA